MTGLMIDLGIRFSVTPSILEGSHMRDILQSFGVHVVTAACVTVGILRLATLAVEHRLGRRGVALRLTAAALAAMVWAAMVVAFAVGFSRSGAPLPPGFDMLTAQLIGEFMVLFQLAREL
jgi:hypothetical protein